MSRITVTEEGKDNHKWWHFLFGSSERRIQYRNSYVLPDKDEHIYICNKCGYCKTTVTKWESE